MFLINNTGGNLNVVNKGGIRYVAVLKNGLHLFQKLQSHAYPPVKQRFDPLNHLKTTYGWKNVHCKDQAENGTFFFLLVTLQ